MHWSPTLNTISIFSFRASGVSGLITSQPEILLWFPTHLVHPNIVPILGGVECEFKHMHCWHLWSAFQCPDVNSCREECDKLMMSPRTWSEYNRGKTYSICISKWVFFLNLIFPPFAELWAWTGADGQSRLWCCPGSQLSAVLSLYISMQSKRATPKLLGRAWGIFALKKIYIYFFSSAFVHKGFY